MRGQIVLVQPVHDQHDRAGELVVEPTVEGVVVPVVGRLALRLRQRLLGFQGIVDDDQVGAAPGQHAADRGGEPAALRGRVEFRHRCALRREARPREDLPVPAAPDDVPAVAREFVGEVLRIADAEYLRRRLAPETPGRKRDRSQQRLQMARRQVDDEPPDFARAHCRELRGDHLDVPAHRKARPRVELAETALRNADEIAAQQRAVLAEAQCLGRRLYHSGTEDTEKTPGGFPGSSVLSVSLWWIFANSICRRRVSRLSTTSSRSGGWRLLRRGCRAGPLLDVFQQVDQHLGRAQIGARRFIDELRDDRLAFGDPAALAAPGDDDRLVERRDEERRQIFPRAARIAGLALLEPGVQRRPAAADPVFAIWVLAIGLHAITTIPLADWRAETYIINR